MKLTKKDMKMKRKRRIRAKISGTADRPRLAVYRSNRMLNVQIIDDTKHVTIVAARVGSKNTKAARELGITIATRAKEKGIKTVVFDRGGYRYHGVIATIADAVREGGITL